MPAKPAPETFTMKGPVTMPLELSFACPPYDRILPLACRQVRPQGISLNYLPMEVEEIFWRQLRNQEFDISESSFSSYTMLRSRGDDRFVAIPVFTSRVFRHSNIFINTHKGIQTPEDLKGKVVGLPEYQITAVVWLRGILQDEYGVFPREVHWRSGGQETPGRKEKIRLNLPPEIDLQPIPEGKNLSQMLDDGELDAMISAREPSCFTRGSSNVAQIFDDPRPVEEAYYRKTKIFPIMHIIIIKRKLYEKNPWIAVNLFQAFSAAKDLVLNNYLHREALFLTLPWYHDEIRKAQELIDEDWWPYGIAKNRRTVETFLRYHHEQGLSERLMTVEDLFAHETLDEQFKI
jgi:4,5-dihydroxyphthalate decarboxylase